MSVSKKNDWAKGKWAISVKVITPGGGTMEFDCPKMSEKTGRALWDGINAALHPKANKATESAEHASPDSPD